MTSRADGALTVWLVAIGNVPPLCAQQMVVALHREGHGAERTGTAQR
jgi:hypothetical protein